MAIERIGATLTAQTGMIGPVSTIVMGVLILGEPMNAWVVAGTALVAVVGASPSGRWTEARLEERV